MQIVITRSAQFESTRQQLVGSSRQASTKFDATGRHLTRKEIARAFGVTPQRISNMRDRFTWNHAWRDGRRWRVVDFDDALAVFVSVRSSLDFENGRFGQLGPMHRDWLRRRIFVG